MLLWAGFGIRGLSSVVSFGVLCGLRVPTSGCFRVSGWALWMGLGVIQPAGTAETKTKNRLTLLVPGQCRRIVNWNMVFGLYCSID